MKTAHTIQKTHFILGKTNCWKTKKIYKQQLRKPLIENDKLLFAFILQDRKNQEELKSRIKFSSKLHIPFKMNHQY